MNSIFSLYDVASTNFCWGSFGQVLVAGWCDSSDANDSEMLLFRTGPFVPPISVPGPIVVTEAVRQALLTTSLEGLQFSPIKKHHIVKFDWTRWNRNLPLVETQLAYSGPEGYILERPHRPDIANRMEQLWMICPPTGPGVLVPLIARHEIPAGCDFMTGGSYGITTLVTKRAKATLEELAPGWLVFREYPVEEGVAVDAGK